MTSCSEGPLWPGRCQGTYLGAHRSELPEGRWHVHNFRSLSCALKTGTDVWDIFKCIPSIQAHLFFHRKAPFVVDGVFPPAGFHPGQDHV